ncbi:hypothetical protein [Sphingomonas sp. LHG3406-1]|uniref:hypothetical protein n=1 Tax=Sphingomonas sp. LHG3406-1 TaxID=2804617 RepID=UPI00260FE7C9|nr:hypothetical protein [Sphingomonas sp. LHG3406-1]
MAAAPAPLFLFLRPAFQEALRRRAKELGVTEADAAARLVEQGLEPFLGSGSEAEQARAERQLLDVAGAIAKEEVERSGSVPEDLTFTVFERIRIEHRALYDSATRGNRESAINRRIARHIKTAVGAEVKPRDGGGPWSVKVSRGSDALIREYTKLKKALSPK